jgi:hypothetical protein
VSEAIEKSSRGIKGYHHNHGRRKSKKKKRASIFNISVEKIIVV